MNETELKVLKEAIDTLDTVSVPNVLLEQVGAPIYNANQKLKYVYRSILARIKEEHEKAKAQESQEEEPKIEIVPAEEVETESTTVE